MTDLRWDPEGLREAVQRIVERFKHERHATHAETEYWLNQYHLALVELDCAAASVPGPPEPQAAPEAIALLKRVAACRPYTLTAHIFNDVDAYLASVLASPGDGAPALREAAQALVEAIEGYGLEKMLSEVTALRTALGASRPPEGGT